MMNKKNFPGLDGFIWWTGIVEGRKDPKKIGRLQVRVYGWHTDEKQYIPSEELIWAQPIFPTNSSNDTYTAKEGDTVFGFFMDGDSAQYPFVFGRIPDVPDKMYPTNKGFSDPGKDMGDRPVQVASRTMNDGEGMDHSDAGATRYPNPLKEPTTSRFARNENIDKTPLPFVKQNIKKGIEAAMGLTWDECDPDYDAKYPYNDYVMSESGHFFDIDDTKNKERINLMHRTGTMHEVRHTGTVHRKDLRHAVHLVHGSELRNIRGNLWTTVERWTRYRSKGKILVEGNDHLKVDIAKNMNLNIGGDLVVKVAGRIYIGAIGVSVFPDVAKCGNEFVEQSPYPLPIVIDSPSTMITGYEINGHTHITTTEGEPTSPAIGQGYTYENWVAANGTGIPPEPTIPLYKEEAKIDKTEIKVSCASLEKDPTKDKKTTFEEKLAALLAAITAPGGGGAGAKWCFIKADGSKECVDTHHATSDAQILEYAWCSGAVSATGLENSTGITTTYQKPAGYVCPL